MRASLLTVGAAGSILATWIAACGSADTQVTGATTSGSGGAATTGTGGTTSGIGGTTSGIGGTTTGTGGQPPADASPDAPFVPGMFDCNGCLCDGATHYCEIVHGGAPPPPPKSPPGPPPEQPCSDDAGPTNCVPLPASCLSDPTCACPTLPMGVCACVQAGGGVTVTCNAP